MAKENKIRLGPKSRHKIGDSGQLVVSKPVVTDIGGMDIKTMTPDQLRLCVAMIADELGISVAGIVSSREDKRPK